MLKILFCGFPTDRSALRTPRGHWKLPSFQCPPGRNQRRAPPGCVPPIPSAPSRWDSNLAPLGSRQSKYGGRTPQIAVIGHKPGGCCKSQCARPRGYVAREVPQATLPLKFTIPISNADGTIPDPAIACACHVDVSCVECEPREQGSLVRVGSRRRGRRAWLSCPGSHVCVRWEEAYTNPSILSLWLGRARPRA